MFMDNKKRDKIILKIQFEDIIYLMGTKQTLKISTVMRKKLLAVNQQTDVRLTFSGLGSRAFAEDVLSYCQIQLLEKSLNNQEYVDFIKKNLHVSLYTDKGEASEKE